MGGVTKIVTVSALDAFNRLMTGKSFDIEKDRKIALGEKVPASTRMQTGIEFHDAILFGKFSDRMKKSKDVIAEREEFVSIYPHIVPEVPFDMRLGREVTIYGRVDGICGSIGIEIKTRSFYGRSSLEMYMDSIQWRLYCLGMGINAFNYHIYTIEESKVMDMVSIMSRDDLRVHPYPGMDEEVNDLIDQYMTFLKNENYYG